MMLLFNRDWILIKIMLNISDIITHILQLIAGIGIFLVACETMSENLEAISSKKLKKIFSSVSKNKTVSVCMGALATAAIQSSSALTVMVIGFVNAGILELSQAATIIFGSEIGTTITGQIVALGFNGGSEIDISVIFAALTGIGVFITMITKKDQIKKIGGILIGFGMLFVGLSMMSNAMDSFAQLDSLKVFLASLKNIWLIILMGAVLTAIIQSSSAMTSIAIAMVCTGLISLQQGIYITLGANVGTCVTGMIAGLKSGANAKRTSLIQMIFNVSGVVIIAIIDSIVIISSNNTFNLGILFEKLFPTAPQQQLAMFHTIFNIGSVVVALPFTELLVKITKKIIKEDNSSDVANRFYYVDENMLKTPAIAVQQVKKEIINMASIAIKNFNISINAIRNGDFSQIDEFRNNEDMLNYINQNLVIFINKLTKSRISNNDYIYLTSTYRAIADLERIGDYSENIVEYAQAMKNNDESFTDQALQEVDELTKLINQLYEVSLDVYSNNDYKKFAVAEELEEQIDVLSEQMNANHIKRMTQGICSANVGASYLKLSNDAERIGDHLININDKNFKLSH